MSYAALFLFFYFLFCVGLMFDFFGGLLPRLFPLGLFVVDGILRAIFTLDGTILHFKNIWIFGNANVRNISLMTYFDNFFSCGCRHPVT